MVRQPSAAKRDHDHPGGGDSSNGHSPLVAGPRVVQDQRRDRCLPSGYLAVVVWTLSGFSTIFVQAGLGRAYLNSIGIAVVTVALLPDVVARRLRLRLAPLPRGGNTASISCCPRRCCLS